VIMAVLRPTSTGRGTAALPIAARRRHSALTFGTLLSSQGTCAHCPGSLDPRQGNLPNLEAAPSGVKRMGQWSPRVAQTSGPCRHRAT